MLRLFIFFQKNLCLFFYFTLSPSHSSNIFLFSNIMLYYYIFILLCFIFLCYSILHLEFIKNIFFWIRIPGFYETLFHDHRFDLIKEKNKFNAKYAKKQSNVYMIRFGNTPVLVITSVELYRQFNKVSTVHPEDLGFGDLYYRIMGNCVGNVNGSLWKDLRQCIRTPLSKQSVNNSNLMCVLEWWKREILNPYCVSAQPIHIEEIVKLLPFRYIVTFLFGDPDDVMWEWWIHMLELSTELFQQAMENYIASYAWYKYLPSTLNCKLDLFLKEWYDFLEKQKPNLANQFSCIENVPWKAFCETLTEIVFINQVVTVPVFGWMLAHWACYKHMNDKEKLFTFCYHFILESARVSPIFPVSMQEVIEESLNLSVVIDGIQQNIVVPKDTRIMLDLYAINRNEYHWENADIFNPDRYTTKKNVFNLFHRFGLGRRQCPGRHFADMSMLETLLYFYENYEITCANPVQNVQNIPVLQNASFISPDMCIFLHPKPIFVDCCKEDLTNNKVYVGISVHAKSPFLEQNSFAAKILVYYLTSLPNESCILIVDLLSSYNIQAFDSKSEKKANSIALERGDIIFQNIQKEINLQSKNVIHVIRWKDIIQLPHYVKQLQYFNTLYENDDYFHTQIDNTAQYYADKRHKNMSSHKRKHVVDYILGEFPILFHGIHWHNIHYSLLMYPVQNKAHIHETSQVLYKFVRETKRLYNDLGEISQVGFVGLDISNK